MLDLKKLITGFLLVSAIVSSSVFVFSDLENETPPASGIAVTAPNEPPRLAVGANAFVEPVPVNTPPAKRELAFAGSDALPPVSRSENLTENVAQILTRELIRANPEGPRDTSGGLNIDIPPSFNEILVQEIAVSQNLGQNTKIDELRVKTKSDFVKTDIPEYLNAASRIVATTFSGSDFENLSRQEPGQEMLDAAYLLYAQAQEKLYQLSVPTPLVNVHRAFLGLLETQKNTFDANNYSADPLGAMVAINNYEKIVSENGEVIQQKIESFQADLPKIISAAPRAISSANGMEYFLEKTFFIRTAFAIPVEITADASVQATQTAVATASAAVSTKGTWLQRLFEWARTLVTEQLKDRLIHMLVQQTITWIQGGGKPQFVTNWKGFLGDAASQAVGQAIYNIRPGLCSSFGPLVELALQPVPNIGPRQSVCTLDQIVRNARAFYDDFRNGNWVAYGAALRPENNLFGSIIINSDKILREKVAAEEAAKSEAESARGFLSQKHCVKSHQETINDYSDLVNGTGEGKEVKLTVCDEYAITTPGEAVAQALDKAIGAPVHRIVNAQDFTALVSALVNSVVNRLIREGVKGISGLLSNSGPSSASVGSTCNGLTGQALTDCQSSASGVNQIIQNAPTSPATTAPGENTGGTGNPAVTSSTDVCEGLTGFARAACLRGLGNPEVVPQSGF